MPRTPARLTQADIARAIRAAKQAGAAGVELRLPGGTMWIALSEKKAKTSVEPELEVVL